MITHLSFTGRSLATVLLVIWLQLTAGAATSVTHYGITWTFSADRPTGTFVNGEPWVIGPVTITNINPNPSQSTYNVQHGSMINPIANTNQGFDSNPVVTGVKYDATKNVALSFPFTLQTGNVLVSAKSQSYYPTWLRTVCALTVLSTPPPSGSFRPGIFGTNRTVKWNVSQMNWSVLKNYAATPSTPSRAEIAAQILPLPWFEWSPSWDGNSLQADDNTTDLPLVNGHYRLYGRETAAKFARIALWLNTNQPLADKQAIAIQLVQNGIDIFEYVNHGGGFLADGGHKCGRKLPLVIAAMMLNDSSLRAMAGNPTIFQEDQQLWTVTQADVGRVIYVAQPGDSWYGREFLQYTQADVGMAEWGIRHNWRPFEDNRSWSATYRNVVADGMMGAWLAAYLMGAQSTWNYPTAFAYMERYASISGVKTGFVAEMYNTYKQGAGTITPPPGTAVDPVITPPGGNFDTTQSVTISTTTPSATIRYTLNDVTPGTSDPIYAGPISVSSTKKIKAIAYATGLNPSGVTTADFTISAMPPSFSPAPGAYSGAQSVSLTSSTTGATIRYTTDGSDPNTSSPVYVNPISVTATTTIKAIAVKTGIASSSITTGNYQIGVVVGTPAWASVAFAPRTAAFVYGFEMTASANNIDAVVGLGGVTPVTDYTDLACIVRFNSSGKIEVRNGGGYAAMVDYPYSAGIAYSIRMIVDPAAKTYSVTVSVKGGVPVYIAQNYAFRLEQASLASFNNMALIATIGSQVVSNYGSIAERPQPPQGLRIIEP
jgi:hypothetical protein